MFGEMQYMLYKLLEWGRWSIVQEVLFPNQVMTVKNIRQEVYFGYKESKCVIDGNFDQSLIKYLMRWTCRRRLWNLLDGQCVPHLPCSRTFTWIPAFHKGKYKSGPRVTFLTPLSLCCSTRHSIVSTPFFNNQLQWQTRLQHQSFVIAILVIRQHAACPTRLTHPLLTVAMSIWTRRLTFLMAKHLMAKVSRILVV